MKFLLLIFLIVTSVSCRENNEEGYEEKQKKAEPAKEIVQNKPEDLQNFSSEEWGLSFEYPEDFEIYEGELAPNSPVINIYPSAAGVTPPLGIHEEAEVTYIALIPHGYGVDGPSGKRLPVLEWNGGLPITFNIDKENSIVYLLENNEAWGFLINFQEPPENWKEHGSIFIRLGVRDFKAVCEASEEGREIPMQDCDPLAGDAVKYYGEIKKEEKAAVNRILRSMNFFLDGDKQESLEELIKVEEPSRNAEVNSPLEIKGRAKGYWFFEAVAPVEVVDKNHNQLGRGSITATEEWMTEELVPFEGSLEFEKPTTKEGFLIFKRANASGKPEHDRALHIPVTF